MYNKEFRAEHPISIHALLAESDFIFSLPPVSILPFLSTLSLRRATSNESSEHAYNSNFYPRSPCGERRWNSTERPVESHFYPRSPCGERQALGLLGWLRTLISIHALLAESDYDTSSLMRCQVNISIHALLAESDQ